MSVKYCRELQIHKYLPTELRMPNQMADTKEECLQLINRLAEDLHDTRKQLVEIREKKKSSSKDRKWKRRKEKQERRSGRIDDDDGRMFNLALLQSTMSRSDQIIAFSHALSPPECGKLLDEMKELKARLLFLTCMKPDQQIFTLAHAEETTRESILITIPEPSRRKISRHITAFKATNGARLSLDTLPAELLENVMNHLPPACLKQLRSYLGTFESAVDVAASSAQGLPTEILLDIASRLSLEDLKSFSSACRTWNQCGTDILFASFGIPLYSSSLRKTAVGFLTTSGYRNITKTVRFKFPINCSSENLSLLLARIKQDCEKVTTIWLHWYLAFAEWECSAADVENILHQSNQMGFTVSMHSLPVRTVAHLISERQLASVLIDSLRLQITKYDWNLLAPQIPRIQVNVNHLIIDTMPQVLHTATLIRFLNAFPRLRTVLINGCSVAMAPSLRKAFKSKGPGFLQIRPYIIQSVGWYAWEDTWGRASFQFVRRYELGKASVHLIEYRPTPGPAQQQLKVSRRFKPFVLDIACVMVPPLVGLSRLWEWCSADRWEWYSGCIYGLVDVCLCVEDEDGERTWVRLLAYCQRFGAYRAQQEIKPRLNAIFAQWEAEHGMHVGVEIHARHGSRTDFYYHNSAI